MRAVLLIIANLLLPTALLGQRIAIIEPDADQKIDGFAAEVRSRVAESFKVLDDSLVESAYRSAMLSEPFNLSTADSRRIGTIIGSDYVILLRSAIQRRASLESPAYFEAFASVYVISSRSGGLIDWQLVSVQGASEDGATKKMLEQAANLAGEIAKALKEHRSTVARDPKFQEVPPEGSPSAKGLRTPVPYKRIRPEYTELASRYGVRATIDVEVDIDADGTVARTSIERWAGYGLEEAVEKAVRQMNWRPAERDGKPLPMRILLRYNFVKVEKDEAP